MHIVSGVVQILMFYNFSSTSFFHNQIVGENSEVSMSAVNNQIKRGPPTTLTDGLAPADHVEFNGSMFF